MSDSDKQIISIRRKPKSSTTLNRRYVKRPSKKSTSIKIEHFDSTPVVTKSPSKKIKVETVESHPVQAAANAQLKARKAAPAPVKRPTAKELKDAAIKTALAASETKLPEAPAPKIRFGLGRVVLALSCAAAAVFAIVYFVNINMPDISFRVAAMQTGINATYPSYVPRGFTTSSITSENGKITIGFSNSETKEAFSLSEERSSWDSNALLSNYVKPTYSDNYTIVREQGLTIYISGSNAAWVNGGIVYKLEAITGSLTNKQIRSIAVSL